MNGRIFSVTEESGESFILDDARPFGIELPEWYLGALDQIPFEKGFDIYPGGSCRSYLKKGARPRLLDAEKLAEDLFSILPEGPVTAIGDDGVLVYALLKRFGFRGELSGIVQLSDARCCTIEEKEGEVRGTLLQEELYQRAVWKVLSQVGKVEGSAAALLSSESSSDYSMGDRDAKGTTPLYVAKAVKSCRAYPASPFILSARSILASICKDRYSYCDYLSKFAKREEIEKTRSTLCLSAFDLLERDSRMFVERYGK